MNNIPKRSDIKPDVYEMIDKCSEADLRFCLKALIASNHVYGNTIIETINLAKVIVKPE